MTKLENKKTTTRVAIRCVSVAAQLRPGVVTRAGESRQLSRHKVEHYSVVEITRSLSEDLNAIAAVSGAEHPRTNAMPLWTEKVPPMSRASPPTSH